MATYQELLKQQAALSVQIEEARKREIADAVSRARQIVAEYGLTEKDVFPAGRRPGNAGAKVAPKYRDPATGKTWNGLGKRPGWLVGDKDAYLMDAPVVAKSKTVKPKKKPQLKAKPSASRKSAAAKAVAKPKPKSTVPPKRAAKRTPTRKTAVPEADSVAPAAASEPAVVPAVA